MEDTNNPTRLGVNDKRHLFQMLLAMSERLLYLNKFPVDLEDFALSLIPQEEEDAFRLLRDKHKGTIVKSNVFNFHHVGDDQFMLHLYPDRAKRYVHEYQVFLSWHHENEIPWLSKNNRFYNKVDKWCRNQIRLEAQLLRTAKVLKAIVHSCNTVGQYKRVSPELLTFLPDKYKVALQGYEKQSPYPAITVEPEEIEATIANLAYASLQPTHKAEEEFNSRPLYNRYNSSYTLDKFPRTANYDRKKVRQLQL